MTYCGFTLKYHRIDFFMENAVNNEKLKEFYNAFTTTYNNHPRFPLGLWFEIVKEFGTFDVMGQRHTDESFFIKHKLGICDENTYRQKLNILPFDKLNPKQMENVVKLYNAYNRSVQHEYVLLENDSIIIKDAISKRHFSCIQETYACSVKFLY